METAQSPGRDSQGDFESVDFTSNKKGIGFAVAALLYEVLVCLIYGLLFGYSDFLGNYQNQGNILLVSILTIFAIVGLGLINAYITNASFSGIALTLLIFALTIQHYFMMRAFWDKAGANDPTTTKHWSDNTYERITLINGDKDRGETYELINASIVDAIACAISMIVAFSSLVGRIQPFEIFVMTLFGSWLYEVNNQLMWSIFVTDIGYGMRIFVFGACMGLIASCILGRKDTTIDHHQYRSVYSSRSLGLIGLVVAFCTFPMLIVGELYQASTNYGYILYMAVINMWLALGAGILGAFAASALVNGKIFLHDIVYSGLAGGIAYSSSCDLHRNPAIPLTVGFVISFIVTPFHSRMLRKLNYNGVKSSLGHINIYLLPGLFSAFLSAILHGINQGTQGSYIMRRDPSRTFIQQGGFQIIGLLLSIAVGIFAGAVIGLLFRLINKHSYDQQFNDNAIYSLDRKNESKYDDAIVSNES